MTPKDEKALNDTLESLTAETDVPAAEVEFSLEEILAEYGVGREQRLMQDVEEAIAPPSQEPAPPPALEPVPEKVPDPVLAQESGKGPAGEPAPELASEPELACDQMTDARRQEIWNQLLSQAVDLEKLERELPCAPRPVSLEEVVGSTVDAVMEEHQEPLLKPRRGLFSRRKLEEDTERLYDPPEPEEPISEEKEIGPEEDLWETAEVSRREYHRRRGGLFVAAVAALVPTLLLILEQRGYEVPYWSGSGSVQSILLLSCLCIVSVLCRSVFIQGARKLVQKRCSGELLVCLSALLTAGDCVAQLTLPERTAVMPYAAVSCLALVFALWGDSRESRGDYDTFRAAAMDDEPPYLVTETDQGACKQRGVVPGFYTTAMRENAAARWQAAILPVVVMGSLVFAGLTSLAKARGGDFLLNWSAILTAGAGFSLPLCWGLPYSRLARHLQRTGCAVAGWCGAEKISGKKGMVLTEADLFPPGTIQINGIKAFGEEMNKVRSYAATMARAAGTGLERVFDGLLRSEGGRYERAEDFSFYEEGGWGATIHGESVLMGTASFMRKMEVRLPSGINLKTGMFLAVDRQLIGVFAVKYNPAENVDYALRMMRRSRIMPILASRDPNVNPGLLRRKFHKNVKVEYPSLTARVALSEAEKDRGMPRALMFREGLLPYAETVVGSRRMCKAVRWATVLALLGSVTGTLLASYLASVQAYELLTPLALESFSLLWTVTVLLMTDWTGRY